VDRCPGARSSYFRHSTEEGSFDESGNKVRQARHVESHPAAFAAIACMLLVRRQLTAASPLLPVDLLRIPIFTLT
jgi:hypothetical protein